MSAPASGSNIIRTRYKQCHFCRKDSFAVNFSRFTCPKIALLSENFFTDLRRNKGFLVIENLLFLRERAKKKRTTQKKLEEKSLFWDMQTD